MLGKDPAAAVDAYNAAVLHGIVKIASKMGISTVQSYQSAKIFECVGIDCAVIDRYFTGTVSRVGGIGLSEIGEGVEWNHNQAFDPLGLGYDTTLNSMWPVYRTPLAASMTALTGTFATTISTCTFGRRLTSVSTPR